MNTPNKTKITDYMLDTIVLKLKYPEFKVEKPHLFHPAFLIDDKQINPDFDFGRNNYKEYKQNPTSQNKQEGIYMPRLTGYKRFKEYKPTYDLNIEFSIPKMLFGQSIQEIDAGDLPKIIELLRQKLWMMGVEVSETALRNAAVIRAHFCKNIPLSHPSTAQDAMIELSKANLGKGKDITIRQYGNGGQALYFYASSVNMIFYDKLRDISAPKNKATDKDRFKREKLLLQQLDSNDQLPEILRFEVRLTNQQTLNSFLSKATGQQVKNMTFENIFNKELCQRALLASWEEITGNPASQLALKMEKSFDEIFDVVIKELNPDQRKKAHSLNKTLASFALFMLINHCGVRKIRNKIESNWTGKSWMRLSDIIKESATTLKEVPPLKIISDIQLALEKFERYDALLNTTEAL